MQITQRFQVTCSKHLKEFLTYSHAMLMNTVNENVDLFKKFKKPAILKIPLLNEISLKVINCLIKRHQKILAPN